MIASENTKQQSIRSEKKKLQDALYYQANKEKIKARVREHASKNYSAVLERASRWYYANREKALNRVLERQRAKRDEILKYKAEYRRKNRDVLKEKQRQYAIEHPEQHLHASAVRRARKKNGTVNSIGIRQWMRDVKSSKTFICYYCQQRFSTRRIHFDHITPLSRGGTHSLTNLCASCDDCNLSKRAKLILELRINGQQLMSL